MDNIITYYGKPIQETYERYIYFFFKKMNIII